MNAVEKLDDRLRTIASLVRRDARVGDVGCDHGYLICALVRDGLSPGGVACDINPKPLQKARDEVFRCGLQEKIDCRLGDGMNPLLPDEVDDVVIAGMGGETIISILEQSDGWRRYPNKHFLLQPMTKAPLLRQWLCANGFGILCERACVVNDLPYTVMQVAYTGIKFLLGEYDLYRYAGELTCDPSPEAKCFLWRSVHALRQRAQGIQESDPELSTRLRGLYNKLITVIEEGR